MPSRQQLGVEGLVDQGLIHEHGHAVRAWMVAGVHKGDQAAVAVDAVGEHMAPDGVLVGRLDLVRQIRKEDHVDEAEPAQQLIAGRVRAGQLLMGFAEVGLQGVDGFQPHRDAAGVDVGRVPDRRGRASTKAGVSGRNLTVSPSGSGLVEADPDSGSQSSHAAVCSSWHPNLPQAASLPQGA